MEDFLINKATKQNIEDLKKLRKSHFLYEIEKLGNSLIDINWPYSESSIKDFEYFIDEQIIFLAEYKPWPFWTSAITKFHVIIINFH